jgi:hypothetical protein
MPYIDKANPYKKGDFAVLQRGRMQSLTRGRSYKVLGVYSSTHIEVKCDDGSRGYFFGAHFKKK